MKEISAATLASKAFPAGSLKSGQSNNQTKTAGTSFDSFLNVNSTKTGAVQSKTDVKLKTNNTQSQSDQTQLKTDTANQTTDDVKQDTVNADTSVSQTDTVQNTGETGSDSTSSIKQADDTKVPVEDGIVKDEAVTEDAIVNLNEVISALNQTIRDIVKNITGIDDEMLSNAMSALGLTELDLLDASNLTNLVLMLNGSSDTTDLLANEDMMTQLNDIADTLADIDWEALTGMSKEEFMPILEDMTANTGTTDVLQNADVKQANVAQAESGIQVTVEYVDESNSDEDANQVADIAKYTQESNSTKDTNQVTNTTKYTQVTNSTEDTNQVTNTTKYTQEANSTEDINQAANTTKYTQVTDSAEGVKQVANTDIVSTNTKEAAVSIEAASKQTDESISKDANNLVLNKEGQIVNADISADQTESFNQGTDNHTGNSAMAESTQTEVRTSVHNEVINNSLSFLQNLGQAVADATGEVTSPQTSMQQMIDIVNQVTEQIKVTLGKETTSMQMQLNPESLGKVLISVSSNHGVMTANFTVQTAEAKEALESQMYNLREALESKSLKVDAVEVEVSDFAFSQSSQADAGDQKEFARGNGKRFRFNFEDSSDDEDITSSTVGSSERQARPNLGSSIDFTA